MLASNSYGPGALSILFLILVPSLWGLYGSSAIVGRAILRPYWLVRDAQYSRLITSGFVHASLAHLALNLFTFYFFAFALERRIGTLRFVALFFFGLLVSNIGTVLKHRNEPGYGSLGASGAILAVLFASIIYSPASRMFIFPLPIPIPAPLFAILYLAYSYYQARQAPAGINHDAHLGGALAGLAFVAFTNPAAYRYFFSTLGIDGV